MHEPYPITPLSFLDNENPSVYRKYLHKERITLIQDTPWMGLCHKSKICSKAGIHWWMAGVDEYT